ncbi:MAG: transposase [Bacteroidota bacterium]
MRKSKFSESELMSILAKRDAGQKVEDICREYQISAATFHAWKKELAENQRRLKQLEQENGILCIIISNSPCNFSKICIF